MTKFADAATLRGRAFAIAKQNGFVGDEAKQLLHDMAGVDSLKQLDAPGWQRLVNQLGGSLLPKSELQKPVNVSENQWKLIQVRRKELHYDDTDFIRFVKHTTRLAHPDFLDAESARILITGMNNALSARNRGKRG